MKKLLRISDKILISLAFVGDFAIEAYSRGHGFTGGRSLVEALNVKNSTFRGEIYRFLKTGDIEKIVTEDGKPGYKLTAPGFEKLARIFPLFRLSRKTWDKKWRVVIFDIQEKEKAVRDSLRQKLTSLGFGKLQESVYVSPLKILEDLNEFLKNNGLSGRVMTFEAEQINASDHRLVANYVWRLDKLNNEYRQLLEKAEDGDLNKDRENRLKLKKEYFELLLRDPILPKELLPKDWFGNKVREVIMKM